MTRRHSRPTPHLALYALLALLAVAAMTIHGGYRLDVRSHAFDITLRPSAPPGVEVSRTAPLGDMDPHPGSPAR